MLETPNLSDSGVPGQHSDQTLAVYQRWFHRTIRNDKPPRDVLADACNQEGTSFRGRIRLHR
jgi:hypothetical protein